MPLTGFLLTCGEEIVLNSVHMDDICAGITYPMLSEFARLTNKAVPLPACACETSTCQKDSVEGINLPGCPNAQISDKVWEDHLEFIKITSKDFLLQLGQVLCNTLSFCGFRLKFLQSPQCGPRDFDHMIQAQTVRVPSDEAIGVTRPTSKELRDCLLYTSPSPRDRTRSRMPSSA